MKLQDASKFYVGGNTVNAIYAGINKVWPPAVLTGHRYWRFTLDATQPGYSGYTMAEVQFRTAVGVPLTPTGGTPSAADTYPGRVRGPAGVNPLGTYGPEKAIDGSATTMWSSNGPPAPVQWWAYDYGAGNNKDIVEIAITARGDGYNLYTQTPVKITPQWSDDGVAWTSLQQLICDNWTAEGQTQVFRPAYPAILNSAVMWLDASQDTARADGSAITSYTSHSPSARVMTAPAGKEPVFRANVGGMPRIHFNGNSAFKMANYQPSVDGQTWIMVNRKIAQPATYYEMVAYQTTEIRYAGGGASVQFTCNSGNGGPIVSIPVNQTVGRDYINNGEMNSATRIARYWLSGLLSGTSPATLPSPPNRPLANLSIGTRDLNDLYLNAYVSEVQVYDGCLSDADRNAVHAYLIAKWSITPMTAADFGKPAPEEEV